MAASERDESSPARGCGEGCCSKTDEVVVVGVEKEGCRGDEGVGMGRAGEGACCEDETAVDEAVTSKCGEGDGCCEIKTGAGAAVKKSCCSDSMTMEEPVLECAESDGCCGIKSNSEMPAKDSCCEDEEASTGAESGVCCGSKSTPKLPVKDSCCSDCLDEDEVAPESAENDGCCGSKSALPGKVSCCADSPLPKDETASKCAETEPDLEIPVKDSCCSDCQSTNEPASESVEKNGCCETETSFKASCNSELKASGQKCDESASPPQVVNCCGELSTSPVGCDVKCIETVAAIECEAACEREVKNVNDPDCDDCCSKNIKVPEDIKIKDCCEQKLPQKEKSSAYLSRQNDATKYVKPDGKLSADQSLRAHSSSSSYVTKHQHQHGNDGRHPGKACSVHLRAAFDKYASYLESARCICKSVLSNLDNCCGKPMSTSNSVPVYEAPQAVATSTARQSWDTISNEKLTRRRIQNSAAQLGDSRSKDCHTRQIVDEICPAGDKKLPTSSKLVTQLDPENAAAREHIVFSVGGMDCSGCANKLTRSLNSTSGTSNVQVVFVTGMAEFDLDSKLATVDDVLQKAQKATGFRCTRIIAENQTLDVLMDTDVAKLYSDTFTLGITSFEKVDKKTYRITFDPTVIGARSVLATAGGAELAGPRQDGALAEGRRRLLKMFFSTLCAAILTIPVVVLAWADTPVSYSTRSIISLVLATFVQALAIPEFYVKALKSLLYNRIIEMDMLVVISISAAYGYSVVAFGLTHAGYSLETKEFFETSTLLITLVLCGRLVAAFARMKAVAAVSLRSLQAEKAFLVTPSGNNIELDARLLQFGDTILIPPHSQVVTDAEVTHGSSAVDESMITGESVPVPRGVGDSVIAGTINGPGALTARLTRLPGKNSITDIANLVESAYSSKPRVQDIADKVASWFIPVVTTVSIIVLLVWVIIGVKVRDKNGGGAVGLAITYGIAVLAVSCPCALGLAVPMVLVIAGGVAARAGVIIKQADATERAHKVTDVVFDKTGTLTKSGLEVVLEEIMTTSLPPSTIFSIVKALVRDNAHPVSLAVASILKNKEGVSVELDDIQSFPGAGITATWNDSNVKAGNPYWLEIDQKPEIARLISRGMTLLCVTRDAEVLVAFGMKSHLRDEALAVVEELRRRNIQTHIVSGDATKVVEDVARTLAIPLENVASRQLPASKQTYVHELMNQGKVVLFCGDGTNDAVAIAQANVGVQIGSSSDITRATADVILLSGLDGILALIDVSKAAFRRMMFNFAWSAIYNVFAILLAAGAFVKVRIEPAYAGLGEIVSVLPVIVAALTIPKVRQFVRN